MTPYTHRDIIRATALHHKDPPEDRVDASMPDQTVALPFPYYSQIYRSGGLRLAQSGGPTDTLSRF
jgi:hypothetical protein